MARVSRPGSHFSPGVIFFVSSVGILMLLRTFTSLTTRSFTLAISRTFNRVMGTTAAGDYSVAFVTCPDMDVAKKIAG